MSNKYDNMQFKQNRNEYRIKDQKHPKIKANGSKRDVLFLKNQKFVIYRF